MNIVEEHCCYFLLADNNHNFTDIPSQTAARVYQITEVYLNQCKITIQLYPTSTASEIQECWQ